MYKIAALILSSLIGMQHCYAQYKGGANDGFHRASAFNQNTITNIYTGGANDGFNTTAVNNQNTITNIYTGGSNDGFSYTVISNQNTITNIYAGGANDGFSRTFITNQNTITNIYAGGANDGFTYTAIGNQNTITNIYRGGVNDGYSTKKAYGQNPLCIGNTIVWNGSVSTEWENPANWDCGVLPNIHSDVEIPAGMPRYPIVKIPYEIKSLKLLLGSLITITNNANFILNSQ
jgi:hypothetical protein